MLIVKETDVTEQPMGSLRDGTPFLWDGKLFIKIPSLSAHQSNAMNNAVSLATSRICDLTPAALVTPVVINEVHIREL